jgi:hypothetical protein
VSVEARLATEPQWKQFIVNRSPVSLVSQDERRARERSHLPWAFRGKIVASSSARPLFHPFLFHVVISFDTLFSFYLGAHLRHLCPLN